MGIKAFGAVLAASAMVAGCIPIYSGYEQNMYAPGGALADKNEGPAILASATDASLAAMFPAGTSKATVMQALGTPGTTTTSTGGGSAQMYMHNFTSYARKTVDMQTLLVEYDKNDKVTKLTLTKAHNSW